MLNVDVNVDLAASTSTGTSVPTKQRARQSSVRIFMLPPNNEQQQDTAAHQPRKPPDHCKVFAAVWLSELKSITG